jgi:MtN3 and saliva related transmembrane protein
VGILPALRLQQPDKPVRADRPKTSLKMLMILTSGLVLWICYGLAKADWIIVVANTVGASLSGTVLLCKLRDNRADR